MTNHILTIRRDDDESPTGYVFIRMDFTEAETIRISEGSSERNTSFKRNVDLAEGADYAYRLTCMCEEGTYTRWAQNDANLNSLI